MKLEFEYGNGLMSAELPDSTKVFIPGETVPDPPLPAPGLGQPVRRHPGVHPPPLGMSPCELAGPGKSVVFVIPRHRQGAAPTPPPTAGCPSGPAWMSCTRPAWTRRTSCCCSPTACTPRATVPEMKKILGEELFNEFYWTGPDHQPRQRGL